MEFCQKPLLVLQPPRLAYTCTSKRNGGLACMYGLLSYIYLGISLSAPVGPINAAQMETGLRKGFSYAWLFGLGAILADIIFMILVYFGLATYLNIPIIQTFLWLFGSFVLIYTGVESLASSVQANKKSLQKNETRFHSFRTGFLMSLMNPLSILFWIGIYGSVLAETADDLSSRQILINSCAIICGIFLWDYTIALLSSIFRRFMTDRFLRVISLLSGTSLIGFGLYFGSKGIGSLF